VDTKAVRLRHTQGPPGAPKGEEQPRCGRTATAYPLRGDVWWRGRRKGGNGRRQPIQAHEEKPQGGMRSRRLRRPFTAPGVAVRHIAMATSASDREKENGNVDDAFRLTPTLHRGGVRVARFAVQCTDGGPRRRATQCRLTGREGMLQSNARLCPPGTPTLTRAGQKCISSSQASSPRQQTYRTIPEGNQGPRHMGERTRAATDRNDARRDAQECRGFRFVQGGGKPVRLQWPNGAKQGTGWDPKGPAYRYTRREGPCDAGQQHHGIRVHQQGVLSRVDVDTPNGAAKPQDTVAGPYARTSNSGYWRRLQADAGGEFVWSFANKRESTWEGPSAAAADRASTRAPSNLRRSGRPQRSFFPLRERRRDPSWTQLARRAQPRPIEFRLQATLKDPSAILWRPSTAAADKLRLAAAPVAAAQDRREGQRQRHSLTRSANGTHAWPLIAEERSIARPARSMPGDSWGRTTSGQIQQSLTSLAQVPNRAGNMLHGHQPHLGRRSSTSKTKRTDHTVRYWMASAPRFSGHSPRDAFRAARAG